LRKRKICTSKILKTFVQREGIGMKKHCHGRRHSQVNASCGFALAETIIALLILSIALLAIAIVPIMSSKMAIQTTQRERAMSIAYNALDYLESRKYTDPELDNAVASQEITGDTGSYTVYLTRKKADNEGLVTVTWDGITGTASLVMRRDLSEQSSSVVGK